MNLQWKSPRCDASGAFGAYSEKSEADLAGIEDIFGVEDLLDALHQRNGCLAVLDIKTPETVSEKVN